MAVNVRAFNEGHVAQTVASNDGSQLEIVEVFIDGNKSGLVLRLSPGETKTVTIPGSKPFEPPELRPKSFDAPK